MNRKFGRLIVLFICVICLFLVGSIISNNASADVVDAPIAQESPLSPLARSEGVALAMDGVSPAPMKTTVDASQTGLVRMLFVLASVVLVIGLFMWRQR